MALKQVLLNHKICEKKSFLESLREKAKDFETRSLEMKKRETDLEDAVKELPADASEEDKTAVEKAVEEFTQEAEKLEEEIKENADEIAKVEAEIEEMQKELDALSETPPAPPADPAPAPTETNNRSNERSFAHMRVRAFDKMNLQERTALVARDAVKEFLTRAKAVITRAVSNAEITVPTELRPMIREEVARESKMLKYVNHIYVPGDARIPVMGEIPEAIWTEQCAKLNELDLSMYLVEVEAYKVGGFNGVCKYLAEDSDENILDTLMFALAVGIAKATDKAILFGTGVKMPMGIVTRLIQSADPGNGGKYARPWKNLVSTNVHTISASDSTDKKLIQKLIGAFKNVDRKAGADKKFHAMNEATHMTIMAELLTYTASGAMVSAVNNTMPVIGGDIVIVEDMPDGLIVSGYGINYVMAERGNMAFDTNDRLRWIEEQILVKATARYDGKPTNPAAFVVIGINGVAPATAAGAVTFAPDEANE
ncbi:MAG: phage major capsid protein [Clostridia bacterium]|nr:phage major capsid protein [Clostridia bacterium]